jgi:hypothetical protein
VKSSVSDRRAARRPAGAAEDAEAAAGYPQSSGSFSAACRTPTATTRGATTPTATPLHGWLKEQSLLGTPHSFPKRHLAAAPGGW